MIKDNQKMLNRISVILDALIITISYLFSYYIRFYSPLTSLSFLNVERGTFYPPEVYSRMLIILIPSYLIVYYYARLYTPKRGKHKLSDFFRIVLANSIGIAFLFSTLYLQYEFHISRGFVGIFFVMNVTLSFIARIIMTDILRIIRRKGHNLKHVLLVGYSRSSEAYIDRIIANPQWGYYIHGILDDYIEIGTVYKKIPVIGDISSLSELLAKMSLDEITITLNINEYDKLESIVAICEKLGVHTKFIPDYYSFMPTKPFTEDIYGLPVINIRNVPLSNTFNSMVKRLVDIIGVLIALILFSLPMLIVAILIKFTSGNPVIFSQIRVGKHNKQFKMYKFRSMGLHSKDEEAVAWTTAGDPRVTKIGKFIRKTSIDELPQLFNVLKGDMSLIGPRPERPQFVEKYKEQIPRYMIKHQVPPGLTGWAQINGYRGDTSISKRIEHDLYYIENWFLGFDFKILFLTIFKGFINRNAY